MELIKKRILIIGSNGKLGGNLTKYLAGNNSYEILCAGSKDISLIPDVEYKKVDITKRNEVKALFHKFFPDIVINTAGFTNVDLCETNKELSWTVNVKGTENIAMSSWAIDAHLIHISSDYIFDGKEGPYTEDDIPNPISYYGRTKLAAENSLRTSGTRFTILRTNVLYGAVLDVHFDFVKWVVENLKGEKQIRIVTDQINNPAFIDDLVLAIGAVIEKDIHGIYNIGGIELLNRFEFTCRIAKYFNLREDLIIPITTAELKQPALRPLKSGLICRKAEEDFNYRPRALNETFRLIRERLIG